MSPLEPSLRAKLKSLWRRLRISSASSVKAKLAQSVFNGRKKIKIKNNNGLFVSIQLKLHKNLSVLLKTWSKEPLDLKK